MIRSSYSYRRGEDRRRIAERLVSYGRGAYTVDGFARSMETPERKKLYRSRKNRIIAGVCGGLADYFNVDPTVVRFIFAAMVFGAGFGIGLYIVLWIVIPEEGSREKSGVEGMANDVRTVVQEGGLSRTNGRTLFALLIILIGVGLLMNQIFPMHWFRWDFFWPVLLIVLGFSIVLKR